MSQSTHLHAAARARLALAVGFTMLALPVAAHASAVNLATAGPFVVLAGQTVTNTGPSVLNGDLGVAPGTALTGFPPGVVNGATHSADAVAAQAQSDLTTAYNVAAAQPVSGANNLTGTDLGSRTLLAGAYGFTSSAQLTGALTLDAAGDPNAQFVFEIGSTLTTASASSVVLVNGASPCNVYWQIGSSATLGTGTAFQGNLMALTSITLNTAATVHGRALARNGAVTLDTNVLDNSLCTSSTTPGGATTTTPGGGTTTTPGGGGTTGGGGGGGGGAGSTLGATPTNTTKKPSATASKNTPTVTHKGTTTLRRRGHERCTDGFHATVTGHQIKRVVFSLDGKHIASRSRSPFQVFVRALHGNHTVTALVTFKDATHSKKLTLGYRACAAAVLHPRPGPSHFTG